KALAAGKGFITGAKAPFKDTYHGIKGGKKLLRGDVSGAEKSVCLLHTLDLAQIPSHRSRIPLNIDEEISTHSIFNLR
ncbi:MAG: hypothetical protein MUP04_01300, partial [Anaerolineae bacterium]|nr:hypothetical protein [Anaerolineae bacterium]